MANLMIILLLIFAAVAVLVVVTERWGKPLSSGKMQKLSGIFWILLGILLLARLVQYLF
jgi:uncharacterized membrane protein HdeD (DUF308 family)